MSDKSPHKEMTKKTGKSIKEKRAEKRAKNHPQEDAVARATGKH
jgi:hypothetical protein